MKNPREYAKIKQISGIQGEQTMESYKQEFIEFMLAHLVRSLEMLSNA